MWSWQPVNLGLNICFVPIFSFFVFYFLFFFTVFVKDFYYYDLRPTRGNQGCGKLWLLAQGDYSIAINTKSNRLRQKKSKQVTAGLRTFQGSVKKEMEFPRVFTNFHGLGVFDLGISTNGCHRILQNYQGWKCKVINLKNSGFLLFSKKVYILVMSRLFKNLKLKISHYLHMKILKREYQNRFIYLSIISGSWDICI